jgi:chemotaxis-related protein WspB
MLHLLFQIAGARHALDTSAVIEVLPLVRVQSLAPAVPGVAGVMDYRGAMVPVVDLSLRLTGTPTAPRLGTRLILVAPPGSGDASGPNAALLVERVLGTAKLKPEVLPSTGAHADGRRVARDSLGFIQFLDLAACFAHAEEAPVRHSNHEPCAPATSF